jgi:thioesterase domain-containing protein
MALQLQAQGQRVDLLALLDQPAPAPDGEPARADDLALLARFAANLDLPVDGFDLPWEKLSRLDPEERLTFILEEAGKANILPADLDLAQIRQRFQVFKSNDQAMRSYRPQARLSRVVLFRAGDGPAGGPAGQDLGWGELADRVDVHVVPGDHYTMMREPNVHVLAERLRACLREAQGDQRGGTHS